MLVQLARELGGSHVSGSGRCLSLPLADNDMREWGVVSKVPWARPEPLLTEDLLGGLVRDAQQLGGRYGVARPALLGWVTLDQLRPSAGDLPFQAVQVVR